MINTICEYLLNHQIGILEHDTIPGIVGIATVDNAKKIQAIKQRSQSKGFIVLIPSTNHLKKLTTKIPETTNQIINAYWPGPLTIIFEKHPNISTTISGQSKTIAIRCPNHPMLSKLLKKLNQPLISTSANLSGETAISNKILKAVDFTYGNIKNCKNQASTIVDATTSPMKILREGSLSISLNLNEM